MNAGSRQATSAVGVVVVVVLPYPHQPPAEAAVVSKCESRVVQPRSTSSSSTLSCQQRSSTSTNTTPSSPYICLELLATYTTSISRHSGCSVSIISIFIPPNFFQIIHVYLRGKATKHSEVSCLFTSIYPILIFGMWPIIIPRYIYSTEY